MRTALKILNEKLSVEQDVIISGYMLNKHDQADKIAVDYAHKVGVVEGFEKAVEIIQHIEEYVD